MLRASAIIVLYFVGLCFSAAAQDRGAYSIIPGDTADRLFLDGDSHALVIGINAYSNGWPRLSNATADAEAIARELERHGFQVTLALDPGAEALEEAIEDFIYDRGREPDARLLIWYAGHGHTIEGEAYLVPADAPPAATDGDFRRRAISMRDFGKYMREARSRHVLAVFDSCFSVGIFETARAVDLPAISRATALPVRQMITSGESEQTVSDDGTFRRLFIDALRGDEPLADANRDGYLTGSELGLFLSDKVTTLTQNRQTPRYGKLRELGLDRGDFVFQVERPAAAAEEKMVAALPRPQEPELALPEPEPPAQPAPSREDLTLSGGQTVTMMEGALALTMIGTPFGARSDLVGVRVNGQRAPLNAGAFIAVDAGAQACVITLMGIVTGQNQAQFMVQCGSPDLLRRDARAAVTVALTGRPRTFEEFGMSGGTSKVLEPAGIVFTFLETPFGARRDLVGVTFNGERQPMAVGQQREFEIAGSVCTLTTTRIHYGENRADFLWRCS